MHTSIVGTTQVRQPKPSAWYAAPIDKFLQTSESTVIGDLVAASGFDVAIGQRDAWKREIAVLRDALSQVRGWVALEFAVPRLGSRIDAVVVSGPALVPIEFKVGAQSYHRADFNQAWDYALDLK